MQVKAAEPMISLRHDLSSFCSRWMWKTSLTSSLGIKSLFLSNRIPSSRIPILSRSCIMLMTMPLPSKGQTLSGQRKGYVPKHRPPWHCFWLKCRRNPICSSFVAHVLNLHCMNIPHFVRFHVWILQPLCY